MLARASNLSRIFFEKGSTMTSERRLIKCLSRPKSVPSEERPQISIRSFQKIFAAPHDLKAVLVVVVIELDNEKLAHRLDYCTRWSLPDERPGPWILSNRMPRL